MSSSETDNELLLFTREDHRYIMEEVKIEMGRGDVSIDWGNFSADLVTASDDGLNRISDMEDQAPGAVPVEVVADQVMAAVRQHSSVSPPAASVPAVDCWPGLHAFRVTVRQQVAPPAGRQPPYVFSAEARKLYTDMLVAVPFCFTYARLSVPEALRIRARPVYLEAHHKQTPVRRCAVHRDPADVSNAGQQQHVRHVLRAEHPHASFSEEGQWCSVTVPLEPFEPATADYTVPFMFTCMNTCVGGMNRRRLLVVFSLEECSSGRTLGRQALEVKVCRCPRRDWRTDQMRRADRQRQQQPQQHQQQPKRCKRPRSMGPSPPPSPPTATATVTVATPLPPPASDSGGQLFVLADDPAMYRALLEHRDALRRYRRSLQESAPADQPDPDGHQ